MITLLPFGDTDATHKTFYKSTSKGNPQWKAADKSDEKIKTQGEEGDKITKCIL